MPKAVRVLFEFAEALVGRPSRRLLKMAAFCRGDLARAKFRLLVSPLAALWWEPSQVILVNWMQYCLSAARKAELHRGGVSLNLNDSKSNQNDWI